MQSMNWDRRRSVRAPMAVPIRFLVPGHLVHWGRSVDLTAEGVLLSSEPLEKDFVENMIRCGGLLDLELQLSLATLLVRGRAVDLERTLEGRDQLHVAFVGLRAEDQRGLERFLSRHWIGIESCAPRQALA